MTKQEAVKRLVDRDVAKWGEVERAASKRIYSKLTHGMALNTLAHSNGECVNEDLAKEAKRLLTSADKRELSSGG